MTIHEARDTVELQRHAANLERQIAALRAALEPFARQAKIIEGCDKEDSTETPDYVLFRLYKSLTAITLGDCRRAREVLDAGSVCVVPSPKPAAE